MKRLKMNVRLKVKKPLRPQDKQVRTKPTRIRDTDPDLSNMVRDQKFEGFFYLGYRTIDGQHNIV